MHTIAQLYMQNSSAAPRGRGPLGGWPGHRRVNHLSKLISFLIEPPTARVPLQVICLEWQGNGARTHASCFQNNADPYEQCFCGFALNRRLFYLQWCILGFGVLRKTKHSWRSLCADRGSFSVSILSSRHLEKQYQKTEDCASRQGSFSRVLGNRVFGKQKKENVMLLTMDGFPWWERWCFDLDIWGAGVRHERTPVELQSALTCTRAYRKQSLSRNFGFATCGGERRGAAGMARGRSVLMRQGSALASVTRFIHRDGTRREQLWITWLSFPTRRIKVESSGVTWMWKAARRGALDVVCDCACDGINSFTNWTCWFADAFRKRRASSEANLFAVLRVFKRANHTT